MSVRNSPSKPPHLFHLDGLRALAAMYVVCSHVWLEIWPIYYDRAPSGLLYYATHWLFYGHYAVVLFIVLSGYCLMLPVIRSSSEFKLSIFLKRRSKRILPPYYFALIFSLLLIWMAIGQHTGTHWDISLPVTRRGFLAHLFMLHDLATPGEINYVFWSIAVEFQIYLLFPLLLLTYKSRLGIAGPLLLSFLVTYGLFALTWISPALIPFASFFHYVALFSLGMFGAWVSFSAARQAGIYRDRWPWQVGLIFFAALTLITTALADPRTDAKKYLLLDIPMGLFIMALLVTTARKSMGSLARFLSAKALVFIGAFSYSLYLIHAPLIQLIWQYGLRPLHLGEFLTFVVLLGAGVPVISGISYVFFLFAERPFLSANHVKLPLKN
jgi:peptidoglycan/LPS O-acetylase OafA/YrhL